MPARARSTRNVFQRTMNAETTVSRADASSEPTIIDFLPRDSESAPATIIAGASSPLVSESDKLLCAALTLKSRAKTGING